MRSGMRMFATRNALVRMRSRYSRLAMSQMLCIDVNSCRLRGLRRFGYLFDEDLFQRRLHDFEASNAGFDDCRGEESLCVGAFVETDLGVSTVVLCRMDGGVVEEGVIAGEVDENAVDGIAGLDITHGARKYEMAVVNEADVVAELFDLIHAM